MRKNSVWYAVYTKPRWEKKVACLFEKRNIEHYCPLNKVRRQWSDRKKIVFEPLFKSYVFVRISGEQFLGVYQTEGVINIVQWQGRPAEIRDAEITTVKQFLNRYESIQVEPREISVNERIRIINDPFTTNESSLVEVTDNKVKVAFDSLGCTIVAHVRKAGSEKVWA